MRKIQVVQGRGAQVRTAALQRVRDGSVLEDVIDFLALVRQSAQEVRRAQAWEERRESYGREGVSGSRSQ